MTSSGNRSRLPRGRHGLTRDAVAGAQRSRMLSALAESLSANGYAATTVADIILRAGVSRETFYQQFKSKQDCFEQAFQLAADLLLKTMDQATPASGTRAERFEQLLGVYLDTVARESALARVFLIEVYAAGPTALRRHATIQRRFVEATVSILEISDERGIFACETLVAAISSMVTARLAADDLDGLRALREPLTDLVRKALGSA